MSSIGDRIKQRRLEIGLSVDQVAEKIGKNRATVYRYESNEIEKFSIDILAPLADALKTTPAYLMGWENVEKAKAIPQGFAPMPETERVPRIGRIACGDPITAEENIENNVFRVELKKQRESAGLSQYKLAEKIGVSQATVGMWESGKREPNFTTMCQLSDFFGISVDELLGRSSDYLADGPEEQPETPTPNSEDERNVVRMAGRDGSYVVRRLSDEQYAAVKALLDQLPDADF